RDVHLTLMLFKCQALGIPAERPLPGRLVDGKAEEVRKLGTRDALEEIFVISGSPASGEVGLGTCRRGDGHNRRTRDDCQREPAHVDLPYSTENASTILPGRSMTNTLYPELSLERTSRSNAKAAKGPKEILSQPRNT